MLKSKKQAALLSIISNSVLIILKMIAGIISGSVSIVSEAIHSLSDLLASIIAYFSIKISSEPADNDHQFGHGKFEDLSGAIEGFLIIAAAIYIIYEAIHKIHHAETIELQPTLGILVMFISVIANIAVSKHLFKVAKKADSIALLADAEHLRTDVYTSFGVLAGLVLIKLTGFELLDPIIALLVALLIIKTGVELCITSGKNLLDASLPYEEREKIENIIKKYMPEEVINISEIKTRKAGPERLIELILNVPESMTIKEGHDLCDKIEIDLIEKLGSANITTHLEPCNCGCTDCNLYIKDALACEKLRVKGR